MKNEWEKKLLRKTKDCYSVLFKKYYFHIDLFPLSIFSM